MYICSSTTYDKRIAGLAAILAFYAEMENSTILYLTKLVSNYLYYINFDIDKFNIDFFMEKTNFLEINKQEAKKWILRSLKKYNETLDKKYKFSKEFCEDGVIFSFPVRKPVNSEKAEFFDIVYTSALYFILEMKTRGNQWTMIKQSEMKFYKKHGFIEVFASPFNSRVRYCSLFESDKVFGSFGDNKIFIKKILAGKIYYKNLIFSPPSGAEVNTSVVETVLKLLKMKKKFHIIIGISLKHKNLLEKLEKTDFFVFKVVNDFCYDFLKKKHINMIGREWWRIYMTNDKKKYKFPEFPKESRFEKDN